MRDKDRRFLVEGVQGVLEALRSDAVVTDLFFSPASTEEKLEPVLAEASRRGVTANEVSDKVMGALTSTVTPQGVVAVAEFLDVALDSLLPGTFFVPVLVEVRDPGNAGTIFRSADASGAGGVVFTRTSVDVYNPKTVRASAGSLFHVPVVRGPDVGETVAMLRQH